MCILEQDFFPFSIKPTNYTATYTLYSYSESAIHIQMLGDKLQST